MVDSSVLSRTDHELDKRWLPIRPTSLISYENEAADRRILSHRRGAPLLATALKEFTIALGLLASDPAAVGPKLGLSDYVWHVVDLQHCKHVQGTECRLLTTKWDWKRPQFFTVSLRSRQQKGHIKLGLDLDNQDRTDTDIVCIMLIARNGEGTVLGGEFVTFEVPSQHSRFENVSVVIGDNRLPAQLEIGSKQCDETYKRDRKSALRALSGS